MRTAAAALSFVVALLAAAPADAVKFRFPLNQCSPGPAGCREAAGQVPCYVTAYIDHGGKDWNCGNMGYQGHTGSDYGLLGQNNVRPVVAGAKGTVVELNTNCDNKGFWGNACGGGLGNYVKLQHSDGFSSYYGHMYPGSIAVKKGEVVNCGQLLGKGGNSGNSTGPHLHFEVQNPIYGADDPYGGGAGCGGPLSYWVSQGAYCRLPGTTCPGACTASCSGKQCGPDGCGGSCGSCTGGLACNASGQCIGTDNAKLGSLQIANNSPFGAGAAFTQTFNITNTGTTTWTRAGNYLLTHDGGETFGAPTQIWVATGASVAPNATVAFAAPMKAPAAPGTYTSYWRMDHYGTARFGDRIAFVLVVNQPSNYDGAYFTAETLPDDTHVPAGGTFTKTWTFQNNGSTTWTQAGGYGLAWVKDETPSGTRPPGTSVFPGAPTQVQLGASESIAPNATKTFSVTLKAPAVGGTYSGFWRMDREGTKFGDQVWLRVIVDGPAQPDDAQFVEQSIPNLTPAKPGARFTQKFILKNTGTNTWTAGSYQLALDGGETFGASAVALSGSVAPGALAQFAVPLVAPSAVGTATGYFRMERSGTKFGERVTMQLAVDTNSPDLDGSTFESETVPDDTHFQPGESFEKSWVLRNTGTTTWSGAGGYALVWDSEATLGGAFRSAMTATEQVAPGGTKEWRLSMRAPDSPGLYRGYWRMERGGVVFGDWLWVQIIVDEPAGSPDAGAPPSSGTSEIDGNCGCAAAGSSTVFLAVGLASVLAAARRRRRL